ncbi:DNA repair protein RecO [Oceanivirga miroungae]|uniref:DNA repair protein RecO n=1 Tax=Oceanivirga miroungae TaxID=1130046 RepID=A0A6I8MDT5_9FUSO|nr:DNA repair protein RecO [Oceanivirga miroungae]VWL85251.1 DNA repair protein RecO [Oceanivirga miroungae]
MEILKDTALVLKRKNVNDSNVSVVLYTKNHGKISCIVYGVRANNKMEKISLNPINYINVEISKTNDNYVIRSYDLLKYYKNIYENIDKLEIAMYIVYVLNKVLIYMQKEEKVYKRTIDALTFIDNIESQKIKDNKIRYKIIISYLRKIINDLGIYDEKLLLSDLDSYSSLKKLENYLNNYLNLDIDYKKIAIGGN